MKEFEPKIQWRSPHELTPYINNAKAHPTEQIDKIASSIAEFGFSNPIIIDNAGVVIAGHGRLEASRRLGLEKVPVIERDDLTPAQIKAFRIADNKVAESPWLDDVLALELESLKELDYDLSLTGFDEEDLSSLLESLGENSLETHGDPDDYPDPEEVEPRCRVGEIWALGKHRLLCGDSTDPLEVKRLLGDVSVNMVFCDPPYGISIVATNGYVGGGEAYDIPFGGVKNRKGYVGGGNCNRTPIAVCQKRKAKKELGLGSTNGAKPFGSKDVRGTYYATNIVKVNKYYPVIGDDSIDTAIAAYNLCADLFPNALQIWWGGNYYAHALPLSSCWLVWDKENTGNFADCELAWTNSPTAVRIFRHMWNGMLKDSERGQRRVHPTQKPQALFVWTASTYGKPGDIIFDGFVGSGISFLGCEELNDGRAVMGVEASEHYCEIIMKRWESFTGQQAQLVSSV